MKQLKDLKKIFYIVIALIIIAGIAMIALEGFNVEIRYKANQKIELVIGKELDKNDLLKIQEKSDEVFGKGKSVLQVVEVYNDTVQITAEKITEEQKNSLVEKVNELYPQEATEDGKEAEKLLDASKITVSSNENARLRDVLKPYLLPMVIATIVIIAYYAIMYRQLGVIKVVLKSGAILVLSQAVLLSVIALTKFPMGRFTTPLVLLVYVTSVICTSTNLLKSKKQKLKNK